MELLVLFSVENSSSMCLQFHSFGVRMQLRGMLSRREAKRLWITVCWQLRHDRLPDMAVYSSSNFRSDHEEGVTKLRPRKAQSLIPSFPGFAREQQHRYTPSSHGDNTDKNRATQSSALAEMAGLTELLPGGLKLHAPYLQDTWVGRSIDADDCFPTACSGQNIRT
jgi:hypothetical protein